MKKFKICQCGCGRIITNPKYTNNKYIIGHEPTKPKKPTIRLKYNIFSQYKELILKAFENRLIKCLIDSPVESLKGKCLTTKCRRGYYRYPPDDYITFSLTIGETTYTTEAHIVAAMLAHGDPGNLLSLHDCDVKMCCNPEHVYFGTHKDNNHNGCTRRGKKHPNSNLDRLDTNSILYYLERGDHTQREIADAVGCSPATVSNYNTGKYVLTTDGSEVLGDWSPIEIPEPGQRKKEKILEVLDLAAALESMKELNPHMKYQDIYKYMGISTPTGIQYRKLLALNLDESDYYLPKDAILKKYS